MTQPMIRCRIPAWTAPLVSEASSHSPACNSGIVRVSWNDEERSPAIKDIKDYLLKDLILLPNSTKVEMRLSIRSAFVLCDREGARNELAS